MQTEVCIPTLNERRAFPARIGYQKEGPANSPINASRRGGFAASEDCRMAV